MAERILEGQLTHLKMRHEGRVENRAVYVAIGLDKEGRKDVLGFWISANEGAKFWLGVIAVTDVAVVILWEVLNLLIALSLVGTIRLWIISMVTLSDLHGSDAAGNGLALAFGGLASIGLWIALIILLIVSSIKGGWPTWATLASFLLVPACATADFIAIDLLKNTSYTAKWPIVVPAVAPLVLTAFALWACFSFLQHGLSTRYASVATWAVVLILSLAP